MTALQVFANFASTTLAGPALSTDLTVLVTNVNQIPTLLAGQYCYAVLGNPQTGPWEEICIIGPYTYTSGTTTLTLGPSPIAGGTGRGMDGTTAQGWSAGATIQIAPVAQAMADITAQFASPVAGQGDALITVLQPFTGAVPRTQHDKNLESISVEDFGAVGDGVHDASAAIQSAINAVGVAGGGVVFFPPGNYLITSGVTIPANVYLEGAFSSDGYGGISPKLSQIIAGTVGMIMLSTSASAVGLRHLYLNGNGKANICFNASNGGPQIAQHTYDDCDFSGATQYCMYLRSVGQIRASRLQVSGSYPGNGDVTTLIAGIYMGGYCGDSIWTDCYVNTCYPDAPGNGTPPSNPNGVGVWVGGGTNNITWRGGKIEWCSVGIAIYDSQGININSVQFDTCRRFGIAIWSDSAAGWSEGVDGAAGQPLATRSITISGCRFLGGGNNPGVNGAGLSSATSAHIMAYQCRGVVIAGNTFRYGADLAYDYNIDGAIVPGPRIGVWLFNAEKCIVVGNDLINAATTSGAQPAAQCIDVYHDNPVYAQHVIEANAMDGTQSVADAYCQQIQHFGAQRFAGTWNNPLVLNGSYYWADGNYGIWRSKNSVPSSDTDGNPYLKAGVPTTSASSSVTNKIQVSINGTTYYLLASTSGA